MTGATKYLGRPDVTVRITAPAVGSAMRQAYVTLPEGLGVDLAQIPRACDQNEFLAGGCGTGAVIGTVSAALSITDEPLSGSLYLLKALPGKTLPGLGLAFTGRFSGRVVGTNQIDTKTGQLVSAFDAIPDIPLTALQLNIKGGTGGILVASKTLCTAPSLVTGARLVPQAGGAPAGRSSETLCGLPLSEKVATTSGAKLSGLSKGRPTVISTFTALASNKIKSIDLTLPKGYSLVSSKAKSKKGVALKSVTPAGKTSSKRVSSRVLRLTLPSTGVTKVKVLTRTGTIQVASKTLRKSKAKQPIVAKLTLTDGTVSQVPLVLAPKK